MKPLRCTSSVVTKVVPASAQMQRKGPERPFRELIRVRGQAKLRAGHAGGPGEGDLQGHDHQDHLLFRGRPGRAPSVAAEARRGPRQLYGEGAGPAGQG